MEGEGWQGRQPMNPGNFGRTSRRVKEAWLGRELCQSIKKGWRSGLHNGTVSTHCKVYVPEGDLMHLTELG